MRQNFGKFEQHVAEKMPQNSTFGKLSKNNWRFLTKKLRLENARCTIFPSSPSRVSRPCCSRLSRGPPRCSRLRRPPLCPCPLRAQSPYGAPSGVFLSSCPAAPELRLSLDRCRQAASGLCFFAKFSSRVQGSTRLAFFCDFEHLVTSPLG